MFLHIKCLDICAAHENFNKPGTTGTISATVTDWFEHSTGNTESTGSSLARGNYYAGSLSMSLTHSALSYGCAHFRTLEQWLYQDSHIVLYYINILCKILPHFKLTSYRSGFESLKQQVDNRSCTGSSSAKFLKIRIHYTLLEKALFTHNKKIDQA